jgi:hypothetical protein
VDVAICRLILAYDFDADDSQLIDDTAEKRNIEAEKKSSTADCKSRLELLGEEPERPLAPFLVTGDLTTASPAGQDPGWGQ